MKRYIASVLSFMLLFCFSACGEEEASSLTSTSDTSSKMETTESAPDTSSEQGGSSSETPAASDDAETQSKPTEDAVDLKVATYNIANGSKCGHNFQTIANDILQNGIEVIGLQEVDINANRSQLIDTVARLKELTGYLYSVYTKTVDLPGANGNDGQYGVAILSKYPIKKTNFQYLTSTGVEQRTLQHATIDVKGTTINFVNTHLSWENINVRTTQIGEIKNYIADLDNVIVTGDTNIEAISEIKAVGLGVVNDSKYHSYINTDNWATDYIDHILYSSDLTLVSDGMHAPTPAHSDHYMVYAGFKF